MSPVWSEDHDVAVVGAAVCVRDRVAGLDLVAFAAPFDAGRQVERAAADAPVHVAAEVEVERGLVEIQLAGVGLGRRLARRRGPFGLSGLIGSYN